MIVEGFDFDTWQTGLIASCANYQLSKFGQLRIPRQSSESSSELSLPRVWVQSLVRELRFHKPCGVAKIIIRMG